MPSPTPIRLDTPLSETELAAYDDLLHDLAARTESPLSLEGIDGFVTALICGPRMVMPSEYLPVLFDQEDSLALFADEAELSRFMELFQRRWNEIALALNTPVENLAHPDALAPLIMDWDSLLAELPPDERAALEAEGLPSYASVWAAGFLLAVEHWEDDWALPEASKDEAYVDEMLDPFYVLITPPEELTPEERKTSRDDYVAMAIWGAYDLRDFWRDRGIAPRVPIRREATPGRNDPCPCGSGKKFKKCCGAGGTVH